jgi:hypothetical protein
MEPKEDMELMAPERFVSPQTMSRKRNELCRFPEVDAQKDLELMASQRAICKGFLALK